MCQELANTGLKRQRMNDESQRAAGGGKLVIRDGLRQKGKNFVHHCCSFLKIKARN